MQKLKHAGQRKKPNRERSLIPVVMPPSTTLEIRDDFPDKLDTSFEIACEVTRNILACDEKNI